MSKHIVSLVYRKKIGSMMRKAVLSYMADRANDDGTGIWCSKGTIANEIEASRQGVINTIKSLLEDGLLAEVGERKCQNGYTMEYRIDLQKVHDLPFVTGKNIDTSKSGPVNVDDTTRQPDLHDPSTGFTQTSQNLPEPSNKGGPDVSDVFDRIWAAWSPIGRKRSKKIDLLKAQLVRLSKTHDLEAIARAAQMYAKTTDGNYHKALDRWLGGGYFENWLAKTPAQARADAVEELSPIEWCFKAYSLTGDWYGDKHGFAYPPEHPKADYPAHLYDRYSISKHGEAA